tara:strand:+ start:537 stop:743 length:207 start_codon:yes stop_codon:yes gene_type:complete
MAHEKVRALHELLIKINMNKKKGLGDMVEELIKVVLPKLAEEKKDCISCNNKKIWLNNFNANIWKPKK